MNEITNGSPQQVGQFIAALRKEHGFTQKELAEQLFLSDKAVSKWERGLSMPDVSLLIPLSRIFGVTTTELLLGRRTEQHTFTSEQVESLVSKAIGLSEEEKHRNQEAKRRRIPLFLAATIVAALELVAHSLMGHNLSELHNTVLLVEVLMFVFSVFFPFLHRMHCPLTMTKTKSAVYTQHSSTCAPPVCTLIIATGHLSARAYTGSVYWLWCCSHCYME